MVRFKDSRQLWILKKPCFRSLYMERDSAVRDPSMTQFERFNVMDTFKKEDSILMLVDTVVTNEAQTFGSGCVYRLLLTMEDDHLRLDQIIGESGEDAINYAQT